MNPKPSSHPAAAGVRRYRYLADLATADVAFEAFGATLEELMVSAADAVLGVMIEDPAELEPRESRRIEVSAEAEDLLLFELLNELVYLKDAEGLLLRVESARVRREGGRLALAAEARGERIDPGHHRLLVDVKAATLHRFDVRETQGVWRAAVVLDI